MRKFSLSLLFALMLFGMFAAAASANSNAPDPANNDNIPADHNGVITPATVGTHLENANDTANGIDTNDGSTAGTVKKNLTGQNIHTSYQNNTNSCASCHQTHTAKGKALLFADTVYNTCSACHDGTLGYADVFMNDAKAVEKGAIDGAGTFGGTHGDSIHLASDAVKIKAAPGGNANPVVDKDGNSVIGSWTASFNCASCHAPHGSYSDRLLQYNPNGYGAVPTEDGGNQLAGVKVVALADLATQNNEFVLVRSTQNFKGTDKQTEDRVVVELYQGTKVANSDPAVYEKHVKVEKPWLYGYTGRSDGMTYYSRLEKVTEVTGDNPLTTDIVEEKYNKTVAAAYGGDKDLYFDYEHGRVYSTDDTGKTKLNAATTGAIGRPYIVKMDYNSSTHKINQSAYWNGVTVDTDGTGPITGTLSVAEKDELVKLGYTYSSKDMKVTGFGVAMSGFCSACHTDYLAQSGEKTSHWGETTAAYRHSTKSDSYSCVRCHFAHGTTAEIMMDSLGRTMADLQNTTVMAETGEVVKTPAEALAYMQDNNKSSALKKFTNMSVCWACHNSSHAETIKNAERDVNHPNGMPNGR